MKASYRFLCFIISILYASSLWADDSRNCALFTSENMLGKQKDLSAIREQEGTSHVVEAPFAQNISSVWIKNGSVLELYQGAGYQGALLTLQYSPDDHRLMSAEEGVFANLKDFDFDKSVKSYRCRLAGEPMSPPALMPYATSLMAYNQTRFTWRSAGNHPDHKYAEIKQKDGKRTLWIYEDSTYGINANEYTLDLDSGTITIKYRRVGGVQNTEELAKPSLTDKFILKLAYAGALGEMESNLVTIAAGLNVGYYILPPKPELRPIIQQIASLKASTAH
jgi:hypothetical protein